MAHSREENIKRKTEPGISAMTDYCKITFSSKEGNALSVLDQKRASVSMTIVEYFRSKDMKFYAALGRWISSKTERREDGKTARSACTQFKFYYWLKCK